MSDGTATPAAGMFPAGPSVALGAVVVRVEDAQGVREVVSAPETAPEAAGTGQGGEKEA